MTASEKSPRPTVGIVGIGKMGAPMAANLLDAGYEVRVLDQDDAAVQRFAAAHNVVAAESIEQIVTPGGLIVCMLPNGAAVRSVVTGALQEPNAPLSRLGPRGAVMDMSSSDPTGTVELGHQLAEHGISLLDAPVSGGVARARSGDLSIFIGGDSEAFSRCKPVLRCLGANLWHVGPLGAGHALKALNNLLSATGLLIAGEAMLVGQRFGLDPETMLAAINVSTGRNNSTENKLAQFVLSRSFDSGFALELMVKDLRTAMKLAHDTDTPSPLSGVVAELWASARGQLPKGTDHTGIVQWLEEMSGTRLGCADNGSVRDQADR